MYVLCVKKLIKIWGVGVKSKAAFLFALTQCLKKTNKQTKPQKWNSYLQSMHTAQGQLIHLFIVYHHSPYAG